MASNENLTNRIGHQVITLDMDGTLEDPWACCGKRDRMGGSETCRHLRHDIIERVRNVQAVYPDAKLVILSWRGGLERVTREWLGNVGIDVAAVFVPGSPDTQALGAQNHGQVGFKVNVVNALARLGVEVVTSFDDNAMVIDGLRAAGVPALLAPRMVEVLPHEWRAGRIGAPLPERPSWEAPLADFNADDLFNTPTGQLAVG